MEGKKTETDPLKHIKHRTKHEAISNALNDGKKWLENLKAGIQK